MLIKKDLPDYTKLYLLPETYDVDNWREIYSKNIV